MDQFDSSSCETFIFRLCLNVDLSINCMVISLSTDHSDTNNESVKNGGLVIFLGD